MAGMTGVPISKPTMMAVAGAIFFLAPPWTAGVSAQERPNPVVEAAVAWVGFADDGVVNETLVGGAARFYITPRVSLGPEITFIQGRNHSHLVATGNVTFDVLSPVRGQPRRVTPFVVAGGGVFQTREQFFNGPYTSAEGAFTAGGGVRARLNPRVSVGADARIGWELHLRVGGLMAIRLGS